jgi:hypothetical protein
MPICVLLEEAATKLKNVYQWGPPEKTIVFPDSAGNFVSTGVVATDEFVSVLDGDPVVKCFDNMTINAGHIVRPTNRCKGMFIRVLGNLIVNGQLTMTARGAKGPGKFVGIAHQDEIIYFNPTDIYPKNPRFTVIDRLGGARRTSPNSPGSPGVNGACGGGGCGSVETAYGASRGLGGEGTSFSGGPGGGGSPRAAAGDGAIEGGAGGAGVGWYSGTRWWSAGGGAGNPGGAGNGTGGTAGGNGTGGLIILFVHGNIIFGANGKIISGGTQGGAGYDSGGGSGGGAIHIFHKGSLGEPAKISCPGGAPGTPVATGGYNGTPGFAGGAGSVNIVQI